MAIDRIEVRDANVHNLKHVNVDVPLGDIVAVAGVSGSGKSSLALGVLYAEGSRRYLDSLSTYTRRRLTQAPRAAVESVLHVPAALALHQRPPVPGIRSTFGTGSELLGSLRLMYSRLASHVCPNGHRVEPSLAVAAGDKLVCPVCGVHFEAPSAEALSFNSQGACRRCDGTGVVRTVNRAALVPDTSLTIDEGAVAPWKSLMWSLMTDVCRAMGVRTDVPFRDLTEAEKAIVYDGPMEKRHIFYRSKTTEEAGELDFTYYSAVKTVENALAKVKDEKGMKRVERFLHLGTCPECHGTRLSAKARAPQLRGISLDVACAMTLADLDRWVRGVPASLPEAMRPMAESICASFSGPAARLLELGLGYLTLDRAGATLSTGERQRMQLARAVRNRTTGVLYVLDEPSIGLHPANIAGLAGVMRDLVADGNSVVLVDHDTQILKEASWLIEMGPGSGANGGNVIAQGSLAAVAKNATSKIGPFLAGKRKITRDRVPEKDVFALGEIRLESGAIHTVKPFSVRIPKGRLTVVTGVSGSGKTTLVLETLVPALRSLNKCAAPEDAPKREKNEATATEGSIATDAMAAPAAPTVALPAHVLSIEAPGIRAVKLIDATPIGVNVRSTVATYSNVHDDLRRLFAKTTDAAEKGLKAGDFSYNTGRLRCPHCDGTGSISLDVQFLPDVVIDCPTCHGSRYAPEANDVHLLGDKPDTVGPTLPELMDADVTSAKARLSTLKDLKGVRTVVQRLAVLEGLGIGYLTLGEDTPGLSGGEAQRLKLAEEMGRGQSDAVFVFDEPTIGLHPADVERLLQVFDGLIAQGATLVVIEHDLDLIRNADWIIDMGPGGGDEGGRIVACGTLETIRASKESITGRYL